MKLQHFSTSQTKVSEMKKPERRYDIDALRVFAVLLLIYFHTAMIFAAWETWHVRNDQLSMGLEWFIIFVHQWHMPLLFLLAGASTYFALFFRTPKKYASERFKRLFLPLIFGILVIVPPQVYVERISTWMTTRTSPINFEGNFIQFYPRFFECCYSDGNLTWQHLWFILYLFVYSLVALPLFRYLRTEAGQQKVDRVGAFFGKNGRILFLALPIVVIEIFLRHQFPHWQDLIHDWTNHFHFMTLFIYGYLLFASDQLQDAVWRNKRRGLWIGLVATAVYFIAIYLNQTDAPNRTVEVTNYIVRMTARSLSEWGWIVAMLGYGRQYLNRPLPWLRYASEIAYPFYILHQTVIIIIGYYLLQWSSNIFINYILITSSALLLTLALCELVKRQSWSRVLFGMKPLPKQQRQSAKLKESHS